MHFKQFKPLREPIVFVVGPIIEFNRGLIKAMADWFGAVGDANTDKKYLQLSPVTPYMTFRVFTSVVDVRDCFETVFVINIVVVSIIRVQENLRNT